MHFVIDQACDPSSFRVTATHLLRDFVIKKKKKSKHQCLDVNSDTNSLVVLCSVPQSNSGILWKLSWFRSTPADALALGMVYIPEIIQRPSLPNLQDAHQVFTDRNQSDHCCNYILKNTLTPDCLVCMCAGKLFLILVCGYFTAIMHNQIVAEHGMWYD